ncbi:MAG: fused MFS/spermidine synthase [Verrucomicrobiota bacterium]
MPAYALTIFAGAFLLFQVQPLIGKYILPWFGGGPGVWTACMLFFQVLLLGGYAYAHVSSRRLKPRAQLCVHLALVAAAVALLPIIPGDAWKPRGGGNPTLQILVLLAASLGLPYFVLSATSPLLQQWFSRLHPGRSPYRLYALSNAGSLLALVSYPFYFETHFTRQAQATLWGWGLLAYAAGCAFCARTLWRANPEPKVQTPNDRSQEPAGGSQEPGLTPRALNSQPSTLDYLLWLLLPACASVLLVATTNKMCLDVAVIPFLWVLPLALYLLSFILCFDSPRWYVRFPFTLALIAALGGICWALVRGTAAPIPKQVAVYSGALFICCMACHGELYRLRPAPARLTEFYLSIAAGGALGGLFVAIASPRLFSDYYELHCGALLCGLLFLIACAKDRAAPDLAVHAPKLKLLSSPFFRFLASALQPNAWPWMACALPLLAFGALDRLIGRLGSYWHTIPISSSLALRVSLWAALALLAASWIRRRKFRAFRFWHLLACLWLGLGWLALAVALWTYGRRAHLEMVYTSRDFYGVLTIYEHRKNEPDGRHRLLQHGRITHGLQFVDPQRAAWPTTYYGEASGIGLAVRALPAGRRRLGLVGLGTGTLAAYGRAGDYLRIYEINPQVQRLANSWFTYLSRCPAQLEVVPGDARLSLEKEPPQQFDLLALDAFSGDAIPVHLLTREAFQVYGRHLKPEGLLAVHISNHYLDLEPVVATLARHFNYKAALIDYEETDETWWLYASTWMLLTRDETILKRPGIAEALYPLEHRKTNVPLWTDDFASLFQILK